VLFPVGSGDVALSAVVRTGAGMSYRTIAAALALEDLSIGGRLVAFSLGQLRRRRASDVRREPGGGGEGGAEPQPVPRGARAARGPRVDLGGGRGRSSTLTLDFATRGPWREERINPQLFQNALRYTHARGPARVLLATLAALANDEREVLGLTTEEICSAAGLSDRTAVRVRRCSHPGSLSRRAALAGAGTRTGGGWRTPATSGRLSPPGSGSLRLGMPARCWRRRPLRCRTLKTPVRIGLFPA
jgi:hypothetical protein